MKSIRMMAMVIGAAGLAVALSHAGSRADGPWCPEGRGPEGRRASASGPGGAQLPSFGELAAVLRLTDEQRTTVEPALEAMREDLERRHDRSRPSRGGGSRGGPGSRGRGQGSPAGLGDRERPMRDFLAGVVPVLDADQVETMADYLVARRDAQRETRRADRRGGPCAGFGDGEGSRVGLGVGRELCRVAEELDVDDDQRDAIRALVDDRRDEFRAVRRERESGRIPDDEGRDRTDALRRSLEEEVNQILSPEQSERLAEIRTERRVERAERRLEHAGERIEHRTEFLATALQLDEATTGRVRAILEAAEAEQRAAVEGLRSGQVEGEEVRGSELRDEVSGEIAAVLDGDQLRKFEALHRLIPGGGRRGR